MRKGKNKDLLKEAIADAKTVRATALKNAKLALEEAFTPKLQSMLSAKLQKEVEGDDEELEDEEDFGAATDVDTNLDEEDEDSTDEFTDEEDMEIEEDEDMEMDDSTEDDDMENDEELDINIEEDEDMEMDDSTEEDEDELDLESIIRELDGEEEVDLDIENDEDLDLDIEDDEAVTENDDMDVDDEVENDEVEDDEEISMTELYKALKEMDGDEDTEEVTDDQEQIDTLSAENDELEKELGEAYKVIKFMKKKLNEVNLINAKLLFTNKLFKAFDMKATDKVKVVETLDRAQNAREAKLVFLTLAESLTKTNAKPTVGKSVKKLTENMARASKSQQSTKPSKAILSEGNEMVNRFKKLANIKTQK